MMSRVAWGLLDCWHMVSCGFLFMVLSGFGIDAGREDSLWLSRYAWASAWIPSVTVHTSGVAWLAFVYTILIWRIVGLDRS